MTELAPSAFRSAPTLAMPQGRPPRAPRPAPEEPDEQVLTSADFLLSGPPSGRRGPPSRGGAPIVDPLVGRVLAERYRVVERIGHGGMGSVYKVQHVRIGKLLAMKLLHGELSQNPEVVRRFKREALAVSKLTSPNTVQVFDFGVSEGLTYLVMELVSGDNLGSVLSAQGPLPFARLGRIIVQVCNALAEAHRKGVVHRDIKPENIMLVATADGADLVKVLDFGLAKLLEPGSRDDDTCGGVIVGTPSYMAPEQILGQEVDARTDVYSLGALMYRLSTGQTPFRGDTHMAVLTRHLTERPVAPADRAPELRIPLGLSRLVMRALRKDPADRFQRVEDLQALLVEELRTAGSSSVENLLDPDRLRRLARTEGTLLEGSDARATRDEVDAYERTLRRKRYGAAFVTAAVALAAAGAGLLVPRDARPSGVEVEPNDTPAEATPLALGQPVSGTLGRRIDASHGDRDFYAFDLPSTAAGRHPETPGAPSFVSIRLRALPSIATCALVYRAGFADPVGRYCAGRPGRDLEVPALELAPGRYLLAVLQDLDPYGGAPPYVQESISDTYTLFVDRAFPEPAAEIEPNDHAASATPVTPGHPLSAAIDWARDEDVFCVSNAVTATIRWTLRAGFRDGALEVTPMRGDSAGAPARVHLDEAGGPWQSAPFVAENEAARCLRVRLAGDPAGTGPYVVEAAPVADN